MNRKKYKELKKELEENKVLGTPPTSPIRVQDLINDASKQQAERIIKVLKKYKCGEHKKLINMIKQYGK